MSTRAADPAPSPGQLHRREVVSTLLQDRGDLLVVTGLGSPTWDAAAAGDHPLTFPLWGGMGQATMVGLGLALADPGRRVLVLTGDGELLMGLGSLATVAVQNPGNLAVVVLDNERYGETGMQESHTGQGVDLASVGRACGISSTLVVTHPSELPPLRSRIHEDEGPTLAVAKVRPETLPLVMPPKEGVELVKRFQTALDASRR